MSFIEKKILAKSDKVFYLGKPQCDFQKRAFKKYSGKMFYYHPSYLPDEYGVVREENNLKNLINICYFGSFFQRNLEPLASLLDEKLEGVNIDIIGSGQIGGALQNNNRIKSIERNNKKDESMKIVKESDAHIVVGFRKGFSIPGKTFYYTNSNKPIIFLCDGPFSNEIEEYLKQFNRFILCQNTRECVKDAIFLAKKEIYSLKKYNCENLSPREAYKIFIE